MTKVKRFMRAVDAMLLPNCPFTQEQFKHWVKTSGLKEARERRVEVEVEEA
jgi:hypothetical protein